MGEIRAVGAVHVPARSYLLVRNRTSTLKVCAERPKTTGKEIRVMLNLSANRKRKRSRKKTACLPHLSFSLFLFVEMDRNTCGPNRAAIDAID